MDMRWIFPLGLLGLLGLLVLIIIYLLKPNYQQKYISSTHIWKLSLQYRRKKIPVSKITNLLIVLCQILIITIGAFALTRPFVADAVPPPTNETIFIIDSSANMRAHQGDGITRFDRALDQVRIMGTQVLDSEEYLTIILAGQTAEPIITRVAGPSGIAALGQAITNLGQEGAGFGNGDINGAMTLAERFLNENPSADITLFTATTFENTDSAVNIVNVSRISEAVHGDFREWNATILNASARVDGNLYRFAVEVASFNMNFELPVTITVFNARGFDIAPGSTVTETVVVNLINNEPSTVHFNELGIYGFESARITIEADDSFSYDNEFWVFSGGNEVIRILYVTPEASIFQRASLVGLMGALSSRWSIDFSIMSMGQIYDDLDGQVPDNYDFYIFEYQMPRYLPERGAVLLITGGPNIDGRGSRDAPANSGVVFLEDIDRTNALAPAIENRLFADTPGHLLNGVNPGNIIVNSFRNVAAPAEFVNYLYIRGEVGGEIVTHPMLMVKNTPDSRIAVKSFATLFSNISMGVDWPMIMFNLMELFFPVTLSRYTFEIGDYLTFDQSSAVFNEIRPSITIASAGESEVFDTLPYDIRLNNLGHHRIIQRLDSGVVMTGINVGDDRETVIENFFVRIPSSQSNFLLVTEFIEPVFPEPPRLDYDIYLLLGLALFGLLFVERLLAMSKSF
ncbi:MAG: VWA domain-containing protein [Firmicutes bacterium]|nr:VWA domain-containing protein [Bacillota bacterium]